MTQCESTYTIDRYTGERLRCEQEGGGKHPVKNVMTGSLYHKAEYASIIWYWDDREQDLDRFVAR